MEKINIEISDSWRKILDKEFKKTYFRKLIKTIEKEYASQIIFPPADLIFNAFNKTPFEKVRVVILGQDPYHGAGQAHGLCFSVPQGIKHPHSLKNIFKELSVDTGCTVPIHGTLESWAEQGVLLLNTTLTVRSGIPLSHHGFGWENFTDKVIRVISEKKENVVFLLWGKNAQTKESLIDATKHLILRAAHPSPFSANQGFFSCRHFSKTNEYLISKGLAEITWDI